MEWVSTLSPGDERDEAVRGVLRGWYRKDGAELIAYFEGRGRDDIPDWLQPALEEFAGSALQDRPEEAILWSEAITDDDMRYRTRLNIARRWLVRDEEAAERWLEQSPLSEDDRERVREAAEGMGAVRP